MHLHRVWLLGLVLCATTGLAGEGLYILITPESGGGGRAGKLGCQFTPETSPPVVKNDLVRFRLTVPGTKKPVSWRVPLYQGPNGDNELSVARVGKSTPGDDHSFLIDLNIADLERAGASDKLTVRVRASDGREAVCATSAAPVMQAVRGVPAKELTIINGAVTR